jgi:transcriptional regulator with XRE-family HTH domain
MGILMFKERLKQLRKERKYTQQQMADALGITLRAYQMYEGGENGPGVSGLIALADYFDVSLDYLVGRSDDPARR